MQRIYLNVISLWSENIILNDSEILNQLLKVLRYKIWDEVIFFNWEDYIDFVYEITSIDKKNIFFNLKSKITKQKEVLKLNLFQSLPNKLDKIEEILQKWCEVWYTSFNIFRAKRSQDLFVSEAKVLRLEKIIIEAIEQSWRNIIPKLNFLKKFDFDNISWEKYYFHTDINISTKLKDVNITNNEKNIFVWPEWGFSDEEIVEFDKNNFTKVNLWANILRTQTAWIVCWFYFVQKSL